MPSLSFPLLNGYPAFGIEVALGERAMLDLVRNLKEPPDPIGAMAMIDTGSPRSVVSRRIASQLGAKLIGADLSRDGHGYATAEFSILVPNRDRGFILTKSIECYVGDLIETAADVMIACDLLRHMVVEFNGPKKSVSLAW